MNHPVFDFELYQKISSRLGRQEKLLLKKVHGSQAYLKLLGSVSRTRVLKKKLILAYLKELAIYAVAKDLLPVIANLYTDGVLKDTRLYKIVENNWASYLNQQQRARLKTKELA